MICRDQCIKNIKKPLTTAFVYYVYLSKRWVHNFSWLRYTLILWRFYFRLRSAASLFRSFYSVCDWIMSGYTSSFSSLNISKNYAPSAVTVNGIEDRNYKDNNNKSAIGDMLIEWKMSSRVSNFFNSIVAVFLSKFTEISK